MIKIAICDDEAMITSALYHKLSCLRPEYTIEVFNSSQEILKSNTNYDIIFLDIEMPEINGMETAKRLRNSGNDTYIVFLTSHNEYMAEAFKVRAFRYLMKPINDNELLESLTQAEHDIFKNDKIMIKADSTTTLLNIDEIILIEAFGDGSIIYTPSFSKESNRSLKYWSEQLPCERFYRIHKSYLIAFKYICTIEESTVTLHKAKFSLPISRRNQSSFKKAYIDYIKKYSKYI